MLASPQPLCPLLPAASVITLFVLKPGMFGKGAMFGILSCSLKVSGRGPSSPNRETSKYPKALWPHNHPSLTAKPGEGTCAPLARLPAGSVAENTYRPLDHQAWKRGEHTVYVMGRGLK